MGRRMGEKVTRVLLLFVFVGCLRGRSAAAEEAFLSRGAVELGVRTGYSFGATKNVQMSTTALRLGYVLGHVDGGERYLPSVFPHGAFEVAAEPFASAIVATSRRGAGFATQTTAEAGVSLPVLTYYFDTGTRLLPFIEGGAGVMYTSLTRFKLGGRFQFLPFAGAGLSYFLTDKLALRVDGRFRHISNADIFKDNVGLNSYILTVGISYFPSR